MKLRVIAVAVMLIASTSASAQSSAELTAIREQLLELTRRVDQLERENAALRGENASIKQAAPAQLASAPATPAPTPAVKAADWPNRVTLKGDIRYRHEHTDDATQVKERDRHLIRGRIALEAKANDAFQIGIGLSTTENGNPRGANQTLDGEFTRKSVYFDLAYFDWTVVDGLHAIGGKMKMPFFRPGQSLFFDNDVNPEGLAATYGNDVWFASAYGFWVDENVPVAGTTPSDADTLMLGGQVGAKLSLGSSSLTLAAMYYDLAAAKGRRPFFNSSSNGNTLIGTGANAVLANDFRVAELSAEFNTKLGELPFQVWADAAQNQAAELDTAYTVGTMFGKASAPGTWEAGFAYQLLEKDALFAQHIDSDFAGGVSDSSGWIVRAGYAPMKNWSLNATYFLTRKNVDVGAESDFDRLLLDFNVKY